MADETDKKYFLVFKNSQNSVIRIEKQTLNELYKIIVDEQMPEGTYFIFRGNKII